ncbi:MAG: hypothetical protein ABIH42_08795, partial [Planctomycetota bacterium]
MRYKLMTALLIIILVTALFETTPAQEEVDEEPADDRVWIDKSTETSDMIKHAYKSISDGNYREAIEIFQGLLEKSRTDKECKTRIVYKSDNFYLPLRDCCYSGLASLPEEGRQLYDILYAAKAERALEEALKDKDIEKLETIAHDYLITGAGLKANIYIADSLMETAEFAAALQYLNKIRECHYNKVKEPSIMTLKCAACYFSIGDINSAQSLADKIKTASADQQLSEKEAALLKRILEDISESHVVVETQKSINSFYDSYLSDGDTDDISIIGNKESAHDAYNWRFQFDQGNTIDTFFLTGKKSGCDIYPLVKNNIVYFTDSSQVFALDIDSGKIVWRYADKECKLLGGAPLGLAESEGTIYAVLRNKEIVSEYRRNNQSQEKVLTDLYAFKANISGENSPIWSTYGKREGTILGNVSFSSIPLIEGDKIFLGGFEVSGKELSYYVVCITTNGTPLWKTRIYITQAGQPNWNAPSNIYRFSTLTYYKGSILFCSNESVVAGLSAATGSLEWLFKYSPLSPSSVSERYSFISDSWHITPPVVWTGMYRNEYREVLILFPQDLDCILGIDLRQKRILYEEKRNGHTHVLGPKGNAVYLYGGNSELEQDKYAVRAFSIPDGKILWELPTDEVPVGKGVITDKAIYIPCAKSLIQIEEVQSEHFIPV